MGANVAPLEPARASARYSGRCLRGLGGQRRSLRSARFEPAHARFEPAHARFEPAHALWHGVTRALRASRRELRAGRPPALHHAQPDGARPAGRVSHRGAVQAGALRAQARSIMPRKAGHRAGVQGGRAGRAARRAARSVPRARGALYRAAAARRRGHPGVLERRGRAGGGVLGPRWREPPPARRRGGCARESRAYHRAGSGNPRGDQVRRLVASNPPAVPTAGRVSQGLRCGKMGHGSRTCACACRRAVESQKRCGEAQLQLCLGRVLQLGPPPRAGSDGGGALSPTSPPAGRATLFGRRVSRDAASPLP